MRLPTWLSWEGLWFGAFLALIVILVLLLAIA